MARKNLLSGLLGGDGSNANVHEVGLPNVPTLSSSFGAIRGPVRAVAESLDHLKAHSVHDLPPDLVDASPIADRFESDPSSHSELKDSIEAHGQQVPILVRPHPTTDGRFQIAYGRRRLRAARELGLTVRAVIKPLTDEQLAIAQGQENTARADLSYIEKARFAARLEESGYSREVIMAALSTDKSGVSRLVTSVNAIPREIIDLVGPAPKTGRDRWLTLAGKIQRAGAIAKARAAMSQDAFKDKNSDERFAAILAAVAARRAPSARSRTWTANDGKRVARISEDGRRLTLAVDKKIAAEFGDYLIETLPEIYAAFQRRAEA